MLESVEWGEYRLGDLFEIENTFSFNKDALTPGNDYDYVTRTSQNQGILQHTGFVNYENINNAGTWSLGLLQMDFFYRRKQWYAGQFVRKIVPKICLTDSRISFFSTILNKQKQVLSSVLVRDVDEVFRNITCLLPTRDDEIDYEFMERFIAELNAQRLAELNAQRLAELNAYLSITGLNDYTLTPEEEQAVKDFGAGNIECDEYRLGDLFKIENTFSFNKDALTSGNDYDYVTRTSQNQGVLQSTGFVNSDNINDAGTWSLGLLQMDFFYRKRQWYAGQFVRKIVPKISLTDSSIPFFSTILNKQKQLLLSVLVRDVDKVFRNITCLLPTRESEIDYVCMETLISAIQKLVIKDVVLYADREIEATKNVIYKTSKSNSI